MEFSEHINDKSYYDFEYVMNVYPNIFDKCDKEDDIISIRKMKKTDYCYAKYIEKWELCNKDTKHALFFIRKEYIDNLINKECNNDSDKQKKECDSEDDSGSKNKKQNKTNPDDSDSKKDTMDDKSKKVKLNKNTDETHLGCKLGDLILQLKHDIKLIDDKIKLSEKDVIICEKDNEILEKGIELNKMKILLHKQEINELLQKQSKQLELYSHLMKKSNDDE
jgi:hypothetical protein